MKLYNFTKKNIMSDIIKLLFNEFIGGIRSVFNWRPREFILFNPIVGLIAVLCKLSGIVLSISLITFLLTYSSFMILSKIYMILSKIYMLLN